MLHQTLKTWLCLSVAMLLSNHVNAAALFTENAGNAYYNAGWAFGSSQPNNFGWFTATNVITAPGFAGVDLDDSSELASPSSYPDINTAGKAWRIYGVSGGASGHGESAAYGFLKDGSGKDDTLLPGQTLSLDIALNFRNGYKGFAAKDANDAEIFTFNIGGDDYAVSHAASGNGSIGNAYSDNTVFHIAVTQTKASGGIWSITRSGGISAKATGTYTGAVANFKLYAGQTVSGNANDFYINNIAVTDSTVTNNNKFQARETSQRRLQNRAQSPVRVACVGDSITYGAGVPTRRTKSYPAQLGGLLGTDYDTRNFGRCGATMLKHSDLPYMFSSQYTNALNFGPDIVVIMLGTNDSKHRGDGSLNSDNAPENWRNKAEYLPDYEAMIAAFRRVNPKVKVFACLPPPCFPGGWGINDKTIHDEVIPLIRQVAGDVNATVIDLNTPLTGKTELFPDTVHPNTEGSQIMASVVYHALAGK